MLKNIVNFGIYGKEPLFDVREITTLREMLDDSVGRFADRVAFLRHREKDIFEEINYKKFGEDVYCFATALCETGHKRIALISENRYEWAVAYMSIVCGVGTVVPIDKELCFDEIKAFLEFSECTAVICSESILKKNAQLLNIVDVISMDSDFIKMLSIGQRLLDSGNTAFIDRKPTPDDVNILLFTSGTSGNPKCVMLSHKNLCSNIMNICSIFKIDKSDRVFSLLPLHHTYECTCGFLCEVYSGASIAYCRGLKYILKDMKITQPTMFFCVPLVLESIYKNIQKTVKKQGKERSLKVGIAISKILMKIGIDIRRKIFKDIIDNFGGKIKMFLAGAAPVNGDTLAFFTDIGINSIQGYGMTECSPLISANRVCHYRNDSVGLPVPELSVKIFKPNKSGIGEICVKGENVMCGYYKNPNETAKVLVDGWLHTGDVGYIKDGFIYITGRKKNIIIAANGENVYPEEIENILCKSEYICECVVFGSEKSTGKTIIAVEVYPEFDKIPGGKECNTELLEKIIQKEVDEFNNQAASFKRIAEVKIRAEEFAKTTTKKIKR